MNSDDDFYRLYAQTQQQFGQHDRASTISIIAFTILLGYIVYYALQFAGLPVEQILIKLKFQTRRMLAQLGAIPRRAGAVGSRRLSTGSQALDSALSGALAPLKAAAGDRTIRNFGGLLNGGRSDAPAGMGNWDNSCYQNSVIQGLASLRPVEEFLASTLSKYGTALSASTNSTLFDTIRQLNDPENNGKVLWMPGKLKSMSTWQQQDAQEYFSKILDEVDKELLHTSKSTNTLPGLADQQSKYNLLASQRLQSNPLEGFLAQRVACMRCGYCEGLSMIPFNCLTVPLGREWNYNLSDCLEEYTKLEAIEGVECAKCTLLRTGSQLEQLLSTSAGNPSLQASVQDRLRSVEEVLESGDFSDKALTNTCQISKKNWMSTTKSRQAVVARAPKSLVVHINRSVFNEMTGAQTKNYAEVSFPTSFDLGPWCLGKQEAEREDWSMNPADSMLPDDPGDRSRPQRLYNLRAVVTHYGRHENGHYVCYRKHPCLLEDGSSKDMEERWWRLSDEDVSPVTEGEILQQGGVFMLFYEQATPQTSLTDLDWSKVASIIPLPGEVEEPDDIPLDGHTEQSAEGSDTSSVRDPSVEFTEQLTEEQRAEAARLEESKSMLMSELRAALPVVGTEHDLTAIGKAGSDFAETTATLSRSADGTEDEVGDSSDDMSQPLPPIRASGVKMRTAGMSGERRSVEGLESPLRMASAF